MCSQGVERGFPLGIEAEQVEIEQVEMQPGGIRSSNFNRLTTQARGEQLSNMALMQM